MRDTSRLGQARYLADGAKISFRLSQKGRDQLVSDILDDYTDQEITYLDDSLVYQIAAAGDYDRE